MGDSLKEGKKACSADLLDCQNACDKVRTGQMNYLNQTTYPNSAWGALNVTEATAWMGAINADCRKGCQEKYDVECALNDDTLIERGGSGSYTCSDDDGTWECGGCSGYFKNGADLVHYCIVSMSTVGYGDVNPRTTSGQVVGVFFLIIGVGFLAQTVGALTDVIVKGKQDQAVEAMVKRQLGSIEEISQFDADGDGKVDKFEFLYTILKLTEEVPVTTLDMIVARFNAIDIDNSGTIDDADFKGMIKSGDSKKGKNMDDPVASTEPPLPAEAGTPGEGPAGEIPSPKVL